MKKIFLSFLSIAVGTAAMAQTNPKTAFTTSTMSLEAYGTDTKLTNELESAKTNIDFAAGHEKTKEDPKVWRHKGKVYNTIAFDSKLKETEKTASLIALESWKRAWALDIKKLEEKGKPASKIPAKMEYKLGFEASARGLFNTGADAYNRGDFQLAYNCFNGILGIMEFTKDGLTKKPVSLTIGKIDMLADGARLGGMAATSIGKCDEAAFLLLPILDGKKVKEEYIPSSYSLLANCFAKAGKNEKAKEILTKARESYPTNQNLLIAEINIALKEGKLTEIEDKLKQAVEADKENVELHFVLGNVYDELFRKKIEEGDKETALSFFKKSVEWYTKAAAVDAKHFNTAYSLGAIHVNFSNSIVKEINEITDYKSPKLKELEAEYGKLLDVALKYLLIAEGIQKDDLGTAIALKEVYARKKNDEKAMEYSTRVKELQKKG